MLPKPLPKPYIEKSAKSGKKTSGWHKKTRRPHASLDNEKRIGQNTYLLSIILGLTHFTRAAQNPRLIQGV
jgi:hypothetical protein